MKDRDVFIVHADIAAANTRVMAGWETLYAVSEGLLAWGEGRNEDPQFRAKKIQALSDSRRVLRLARQAKKSQES